MDKIEKIDCTTCKYGYEDERLSIPMCHHPKRFSDDCVDFNMYEEKHPDGKSDKSLEEAAEKYAEPYISTVADNVKWAFKAGAEWQKSQMLKDAVEGEVYKFGEVAYVKERNNAELTKYLSQFNNGDKVRIVITKEEGRI